jgi:hypothetical protein
MAQPRPIRLREAPQRAPQHAEIIDVPFKVVKGRQSLFVRAGRWVLAFAAAAAIGFLVPPLWVLVQNMAAAG